MATLVPLTFGTPPEIVHTLPLLSTICFADGIMLPLVKGEPAPVVPPPPEEEVLLLEEVPLLEELLLGEVPLLEELLLGEVPLLEELLLGEVPLLEELLLGEVPLLELLDEDEPDPLLTAAPGVQAGRPPTGAGALWTHCPFVGKPIEGWPY
jgi:hypothetical protein